MRLFEMEIPEIYDGTIVVKNAVHEPGDCITAPRTNAAVSAVDRLLATMRLDFTAMPLRRECALSGDLCRL